MALPRRMQNVVVGWCAAGGTPATYPVFDVSFDNTVMEFIDNGELVGAFQSAAAFPGGRYATIEFSTHLRGAANSTDVPEGILLQACGFTKSGSIADTYALGTQGTYSADITVNIDGLYLLLENCVGNVVLDFEAGKLPFARWSFTGSFDTGNTGIGTAVATVAHVTTNLNDPYPCVNGTTSISSQTTLIVPHMIFDVGNNIALRPDVDGLYGYSAPLLAGRDPSYTLVVEAPTLSTLDFEDLAGDRTAMAVSYVHKADDSVNDKFTVTATGYQRQFPAKVNRNGLLYYTAVLKQSHSTGALTIAYAAS